MVTPVAPNDLATFPRTIPDTAKSASENVVLTKPKSPSTGIKNTGRKVINNPLTNDPTVAPRTPPVAFPKTPAVAPVKKCGTTPGKMITEPVSARITMPTIPPAKLEKNPIKTAFGAYGNTIGQSRAGLEFGTSFVEIPLNAGTISAKTRRTPERMINTPAAKVTP